MFELVRLKVFSKSFSLRMISTTSRVFFKILLKIIRNKVTYLFASYSEMLELNKLHLTGLTQIVSKDAAETFN